MNVEDFSKYEKARILGARALQIAMNAPILIKISQEDLEKIKFDALKIAEIELNSNILPISIRKPFPLKKEEKLKKPKEQPKNEDEKIDEMEAEEEKEIAEESEIMEIVNDDEEEESDEKEDLF